MESMLNTEALDPSRAVVIPGSDETTSPLTLQVIETGISPYWMLHMSEAYAPSLRASSLGENENGAITGGTEIK